MHWQYSNSCQNDILLSTTSICANNFSHSLYPMWGPGTGMSMCTDCKPLWGKFVICDIGLYKMNWIEIELNFWQILQRNATDFLKQAHICKLWLLNVHLQQKTPSIGIVTTWKWMRQNHQNRNICNYDLNKRKSNINLCSASLCLQFWFFFNDCHEVTLKNMFSQQQQNSQKCNYFNIQTAYPSLSFRLSIS